MTRVVRVWAEHAAPHLAVGFAIGMGLGLYDTVAGGFLFAALVVLLLASLHCLAWVWPLAFPDW